MFTLNVDFSEAWPNVFGAGAQQWSRTMTDKPNTQHNPNAQQNANAEQNRNSQYGADVQKNAQQVAQQNVGDKRGEAGKSGLKDAPKPKAENKNPRDNEKGKPMPHTSHS